MFLILSIFNRMPNIWIVHGLFLTLSWISGLKFLKSQNFSNCRILYRAHPKSTLKVFWYYSDTLTRWTVPLTKLVYCIIKYRKVLWGGSLRYKNTMKPWYSGLVCKQQTFHYFKFQIEIILSIENCGNSIQKEEKSCIITFWVLFSVFFVIPFTTC